MRHMTILLALASATLIACGDDKERIIWDPCIYECGEGGAGGSDDAGGGGSSAGSGGAPAPTACESACTKAETCGDVSHGCDYVGVDCADDPISPDPHIRCLIDCVGREESTCEDIGAWLRQGETPQAGSAFIQCLAACPDSTLEPEGIKSGLDACVDCAYNVDDHCDQPIATCSGDTACLDWITCVQTQACTNPACFDACDAANPNAAPLRGDVYACLCAMPTEATVMLGYGDATCADACDGVSGACAKAPVAN